MINYQWASFVWVTLFDTLYKTDNKIVKVWAVQIIKFLLEQSKKTKSSQCYKIKY